MNTFRFACRAASASASTSRTWWVTRTLLIAAIGLGSTGFAGAQEQPPAAAQPPIPHLIFFFGDSITKAGGYFKTIRAELQKQNPANPPDMHNFGHMSETVSNLSEAYHPGRRPCIHNWIGNVVSEKPDLVVACYGINDAIYHPYSEERFAAYKKGIEALIAKFHAVGSHVVLLTPPPFAAAGPPFPPGTDDEARKALLAKANAEAEQEAQANPQKFGFRTPYAYYDEVMARYAEWLLTLADREGVSVVDIRTPMLARIKETHGGDPIHPNNVGHQIMAETFLKAWPGIVAKASAAKDAASAGAGEGR
jgi:lysophospholipase L1-like esterase